MLGLKPRDQSKVSHFKEVLWVWRDLLKILSWFFSWAFWQFSLKAKRYFSLSNKEKNNYYLPWSCFVQKLKHIRECRSLKQNLSSLFLLWQKLFTVKLSPEFSQVSFRSTYSLFQIAYEGDFGSLCTVTFWQKVDFLISKAR